MTDAPCTIDTIKTMRGGELLAYVRDTLIERARWVDPNWGEESARYHDVICAAALAIDVIVAAGKAEAAKMAPVIAKCKADGKKPPRLHALVEGPIEAIRSGLIAEMMRRAPKAAEQADAAA